MVTLFKQASVTFLFNSPHLYRVSHLSQASLKELDHPDNHRPAENSERLSFSTTVMYTASEKSLDELARVLIIGISCDYMRHLLYKCPYFM